MISSELLQLEDKICTIYPIRTRRTRAKLKLEYKKKITANENHIHKWQNWWDIPEKEEKNEEESKLLLRERESGVARIIWTLEQIQLSDRLWKKLNESEIQN